MSHRPVALVLALLLPGLVACLPSEEEFRDEQVTIACEYFMECYSGEDGYVYFSFDSQSECEAFFDAFGDYYGDYYEDCTYDKKEAKGCLDAYDSITCEASDIGYSACDAVYDCG
jgi:hypothetical protein